MLLKLKNILMNYKERCNVYNEYFSLGHLNSDIKDKFALISLLCEVTKLAKEKNPDASHYRILYKLNEDLHLPDNFIIGLSIICDDFAYGCKEFITFGLKPKDYITTIKNILSSYTPF